MGNSSSCCGMGTSEITRAIGTVHSLFRIPSIVLLRIDAQKEQMESKGGMEISYPGLRFWIDRRYTNHRGCDAQRLLWADHLSCSRSLRPTHQDRESTRGQCRRAPGCLKPSLLAVLAHSLFLGPGWSGCGAFSFWRFGLLPVRLRLVSVLF